MKNGTSEGGGEYYDQESSSCKLCAVGMYRESWDILVQQSYDVAEQSTADIERCDCIESNGQETVIHKGKEHNMRTMDNGEPQWLPANHGAKECKPHDMDTAPSCVPPELEKNKWCSSPWCFVDKKTCNLSDITQSMYFPNTELYYSYTTCGAKDLFSTSGAALAVKISNNIPRSCFSCSAKTGYQDEMVRLAVHFTPGLPCRVFLSRIRPLTLRPPNHSNKSTEQIVGWLHFDCAL